MTAGTTEQGATTHDHERLEEQWEAGRVAGVAMVLDLIEKRIKRTTKEIDAEADGIRGISRKNMRRWERAGLRLLVGDIERVCILCQMEVE